jgi:glycosyltransferase A (GT-A) superfamily protein (DUF2064 family)
VIPGGGCCVLLFARAPRLEARRKGLPGAEPVFGLAEDRVAAAAAAIGFDLLVVGDAARVRPGSPSLRQRGRGFGERLRNAVADARALGYARMLVVPGDVPGLLPTHLARAAAVLERGGVALGPSPDGGVYVLGLCAGRESVLRGVRWRTAEVLRDLTERAAGTAVVLEPLGDLDRPRDLVHLLRAALHDPVLRELVRSIHPIPRRPRPDVPRALLSGFRVGLEPLRGPPAPA